MKAPHYSEPGKKNMLLSFVSLFFIVGAYLLGSISSAILACKLLQLPDPRTQGSGNPGATNVLRMAGKKLAILVLIGDALKGALPVLLAKYVGCTMSELSWIACAAFLGHLYPVFFGFRGGKGVATAIGGLLALAWPLACTALLTWLVVLIVFRYVSLASIIAAISVAICAWWLVPHTAHPAIVLMSTLLIWRHRANMQRLLAGTENKLGKR